MPGPSACLGVQDKEVRMMRQRTITALLVATLAATVLGQSSGGSFQIVSHVVAGGGGVSTDNGNLSVEGTINGTSAGSVLSNSPFSLTGGFWPPLQILACRSAQPCIASSWPKELTCSSATGAPTASRRRRAAFLTRLFILSSPAQLRSQPPGLTVTAGIPRRFISRSSNRISSWL